MRLPTTAYTNRRWNRLSPPRVMAGLDPAIGYPHQFENDAVPVNNQPMEMADRARVEPSDDVVGLSRAVRQQLWRLGLEWISAGPLIRVRELFLAPKGRRSLGRDQARTPSVIAMTAEAFR